jgi:low temperature requirement protein LtrA
LAPAGPPSGRSWSRSAWWPSATGARPGRLGSIRDDRERRHRLLRRRDEGVAQVRPIELFFDFVYVFAIGQLSHHLLEHVDLRTGAETAILTLAVIYAWYMTAWGMNWLEPDRLPVRLYLVGLMFASLLISVAITDAFDGRAWLFVTGYLLFQLVRAAFLIGALRGKALGEHFVNDLVWELASGGGGPWQRLGPALAAWP